MNNIDGLDGESGGDDWLQSGPQPGETAGEIGKPDTSLEGIIERTAEGLQPVSVPDPTRAVDLKPEEKNRPAETQFLPNKFRNEVKTPIITFLRDPFNEYILALDKVLPGLEAARREKRHEGMGAKSILKSFIRGTRKMVNFLQGTGELPPLKFTENEHSKKIANLFAVEICAHPTNRLDVIIALKDVLKRIFEGVLKKEGIEKFAGDIRPFMETQFRGLLVEIIDALSRLDFEVPVNKGNLTLNDLRDRLKDQKDTIRLFN